MDGEIVEVSGIDIAGTGGQQVGEPEDRPFLV